MKKRNEDKNLSSLAITLLIILLLIVFVGISNKKSSGVLWNGYDTKKTTEVSYITLRGFSNLYFKSGETAQEFSYFNPENNTCIMDIALFDNNGELIFKQENIHPGYGIKEININNPLPKGIYKKCKFAVKCYSPDGIIYNGANITVDLYVR